MLHFEDMPSLHLCSFGTSPAVVGKAKTPGWSGAEVLNVERGGSYDVKTIKVRGGVAALRGGKEQITILGRRRSIACALLAEAH